MATTITPKKRAQITLDALKIATDKCIKVLSDEKRGPESIAKCFPTYSESHPELLDALRKTVVDLFNQGIPKAWEVHANEFNFVPLANDLDDLMKEAAERKSRGDKPLNMHLKSADPNLSIPSQTIPLLEQGTKSLREKRIALQQKNQQTYAEIERLSKEQTRVEKQIEEILLDFEKSMEVLEGIDMASLEVLREKLEGTLK